MKGLSILLFVLFITVLIGFFYMNSLKIEEFFAMSPGTLVQLASTRAERPVMLIPYPMKKREYAMVDNMMNDRLELLHQAVAQPHWMVDRIGYTPYSIHDSTVVVL